MQNLQIRFLLLPLAVAATMLTGCTSVRRGVLQGTDHGQPAASVAPAAGEELVTLTTRSGTKIVALFGTATEADGRERTDAAQRPTVLYFYPGGYTVQRSRAVFDGFRRLGCNVLVPEYPGFGLSSGKPTERACYEAADAALAHLQTRPDLDRRRILFAGWSVGGGVAIDLAARQPAAGLIVIGTSTRIQDVARNLADRRGATAWIPSWFLWTVTTPCRLDSIAKIPAVSCPTLIVYGERDELATKAMAERLAAATKPGAKLVQIDGVGHGEFFRTNAAPLWRELTQWIEAGEAPSP